MRTAIPFFSVASVGTAIGILASSVSFVRCASGPAPHVSTPAETPAASSDSAASAPDAGENTTTAPMERDGGSEQAYKLPLVSAGSDASAISTLDSGPRRAHEAGREQEDIRTAILARREETHACLAKTLSDASTGEQGITMQWTIDPSGHVPASSIHALRSQGDDPVLFHCIAGVLKTLVFPASPGGYETKASYPFILHRQRN